MKLIDFNEFIPFETIRTKLGIPKNCDITYDSSTEFQEVEFEKNSEWVKRLIGEGQDIKSLDELTVNRDKTLEYRGKKIILYIRDQYSYKTQYKYHVAWCETLQKMSLSKRLNRYVVSRRTDGTFIANILDKETHKPIEENIERKLGICKNCLKTLNYNGYTDVIQIQKNKIYKAFNIKEFLNQYDTEFKQIPKYTDLTSPLNEYADNWSEIARDYKRYKNWTCEECGEVFFNNPQMLDVHHIDGSKYNNSYSNLRVLCKKCHAKQPYHEHYKKLIKI
ncbi:HNH endonuclease signature motif containing protein [Clostridium aestuarii]|uniref:HNH endonuclease signature motif containing protein n=1 Tax=Clostridium aestuarii TaxID=338193 RepID=A0ABT4CW15_9CLOT|nr:HNH endonuclease signature motif containing protein [Clostridium aestuarii]MCY6482997.1 HNH endonuclease signature motif containing protein [Clostridium aestuarii]